jgi:Coenzyme PQQ synthesis protein D (PqqD)
LLSEGTLAVISNWDESIWVSKSNDFYEIRNEGGVVSLGREERFVRSESFVARIVAGETLVLPDHAKVGDLVSIYSFNGTAGLIWKLLQTPKTVAELATAIAQEFEVEPERVERDVAEFVSAMKAVGLIAVPAAMAMAGD